ADLFVESFVLPEVTVLLDGVFTSANTALSPVHVRPFRLKGPAPPAGQNGAGPAKGEKVRRPAPGRGTPSRAKPRNHGEHASSAAPRPTGSSGRSWPEQRWTRGRSGHQQPGTPGCPQSGAEHRSGSAEQ